MKNLTSYLVAISISIFLISCSNAPKQYDAPVEETIVEETINSESNTNLASGVYQLNVTASKVTWAGEKKLVDKKHHGTINLSEGSLTLTEGNPTAGNFVLDMTSIIDLDVTDPEWNAKLVGHLKSDDFFNVEQFPTASFILASSAVLEGDANATHTLTGDLTIRGITNPVSFPATIQVSEEGVFAAATVIFDRSKYDVKYDSESFFENLGDKIIKDEIEIGLSLQFAE